MYVGIFARRKISPILSSNLIGENIINYANFLSHIKDCIEDMVTFTALAKKIFHKNFLQYKDSLAWQNFLFSHIIIWYIET